MKAIFQWDHTGNRSEVNNVSWWYVKDGLAFVHRDTEIVAIVPTSRFIAAYLLENEADFVNRAEPVK